MAKIAILGFGTVGSGVSEVLRINADDIFEKTGEAITVKYILDSRNFPDSPFADRMVKDFSMIEKDPEVEVVVECIGGVGVASDYATRALCAGKHVVTSNKALVAANGAKLLTLSKERGVNFLFEAAVGGGIPILRPLSTCLAGNQITEICGILNGTTNYILTKMRDDGASFEEVLAEAQKMGIAEADPTDDVEGIDAGRKICILTALAFGSHVYPGAIHVEGVRGITANDARLAEKAGMSLKLIGRTKRQPDGRVITYVAPHLVDRKSLIASVDGVFNGIMVRGNAVGEVLFVGPGAGKMPTASAVVGDVIDAIRHRGGRQHPGWSDAKENGVFPFAEIPMRWYLRVGASHPGFPGTVLLAEADGEKAFVTEPMTQKTLLSKNFGARSTLALLDT